MFNNIWLLDCYQKLLRSFLLCLPYAISSSHSTLFFEGWYWMEFMKRLMSLLFIIKTKNKKTSFLVFFSCNESLRLKKLFKISLTHLARPHLQRHCLCYLLSSVFNATVMLFSFMVKWRRQKRKGREMQIGCDRWNARLNSTDSRRRIEKLFMESMCLCYFGTKIPSSLSNVLANVFHSSAQFSNKMRERSLYSNKDDDNEA